MEEQPKNKRIAKELVKEIIKADSEEDISSFKLELLHSL